MPLQAERKDSSIQKAGSSPYGSHASMVNEEMSKKLLMPEIYVVCVDEIGPYVTDRKVLDSGMADPNRYSRRPHQLGVPVDRYLAEAEKAMNDRKFPDVVVSMKPVKETRLPTRGSRAFTKDAGVVRKGIQKK